MRHITPKQMILPIMLFLPAGLVLLFEGLKGQSALMAGWVTYGMAPVEQLLGRVCSLLPWFSVAEVLVVLFLLGSVAWVVQAVVLLVRHRRGRDFLRRLLAFAATSQYRDFLLETASSLCGLFPQEGSVLLVAPRDLPFADDLAKAFGKGCRVEASDAIRLGGLQCQNQEAGLFADETLDSKLEDQRAWFAAASGLTVE